MLSAMFRATRLFPTAFAALALAACAPVAQAPERATAQTPLAAASFYPHETGLAWEYLPAGEALTRPRYRLSVQGSAEFAGQRAVAYRMEGRGSDQSWFRQVGEHGVRLLGFTKPGLVVTLNPPMQELPPAGAWRAGLSWDGESELQVIQGREVVQRGRVSWRFVVLEQRSVSVPDGTHNVWVVSRQLRDDVGGLFPLSEQLWFAPHVGEVRTPEGLLLVARNTPGRP